MVEKKYLVVQNDLKMNLLKVYWPQAFHLFFLSEIMCLQIFFFVLSTLRKDDQGFDGKEGLRPIHQPPVTVKIFTLKYTFIFYVSPITYKQPAKSRKDFS